MNPIESTSPSDRIPANFPIVPWRIRDLLAGILFAVLGIVALNVAAALLVYAWHIPILDNGTTLALFVVIQDVVVVLGALLFSVFRYHVGLDRLGLRRFDVAHGLGLIALLFILSYAIRFCFVITMMALGVQLQPQQVMLRLDTTGWTFFLTFFSAAILAPFAEEVFFRGFLYGGLRARIGAIGAMVMSTVFFTALHFSLDAFIPILVLGFCLAWLYERTGSLYPGIILHASNNAIAIIGLFIAQWLGVKLQ
ncbi:MAG: CPBP family intramembrane metalloprotease [Chloroflexi bacterium]|nr:CPBP family intramembrane metalloprotease [Chloroflexota bacterium]